MRFRVDVYPIDPVDETSEDAAYIADTSTLTMEVEAPNNFEALIAAPQTGVVV